MRSKLSVAIMTLTILASMVLPFGTVNRALAIDGKTVLNASDGGDFCESGAYCSPANGIKLTQIGGDPVNKVSQYSDAVDLKIDMILGRDGDAYTAKDQDTGLSGHGALDWNDLKESAWDAFYNEINFNGAVNGGGNRDNGFFLQVSKGKTTKADVDTGQSSAELLNDSSNVSNFQVRKPDVAPGDAGSLYSLARKTSSPGDNSAVELLKIFSAYPEKFYKKDSFNPVVAITNLEPNTTYYFQLVAEEDNSTNWFFSNVVEVKTKADAPENKFGAVPIEDAVKEALGQTPEQSGQDAFVADLDCSITKWSPCFVILFNDIFVSTSHWLAQQAGRLFDAFAAVSLGSTIYGQGTNGADIASFVENGWSVVRDVANIFFIFILLYAALSLVLSLHLHGTSVKKIVSQVIIVALLINFSLFFCRVAIDASNVLSRVFYNAMDISSVGNPATTFDDTAPKEKSISAAVISGIQPQKLLSGESLEKLRSNGQSVTPGTLFMVLLISFILNIIMAWIFFMCAAFFAGRVGVIWFSMIFAPIAFVSSIVPSLDHGLKQLGWGEWLKTFLSACFKAPVFFFFLYLIVNLVGGPGGGLLGSTIGAITNAQNGNWVAFLVGILLPTMIVIGLLMEAKKQAESMAGQFGGAFAGVIAAGTGMVAMAATGGAAALGARFIGGKAADVANSDRLKDMASGKVKNKDGTIRDATKFERWQAQQKLRVANNLKSASFDARQTGLGNVISKATNVNMNTGAGLLNTASTLAGVGVDLSTGARAGGYTAMVDRDTKKAKEDEKIFGSGYDKKQYADEEKKMKDRETEISDQTDVVARGEEEIAKLRSDAEAAGKKSPAGKAIMATVATKQAALSTEKEKLRTLQKGSGEKIVDASGKTRAISKSDIGNAVEVKKRDGSTSVKRITAADFENSRSLTSMQKNLENLKTARLKQYHLSLMKEGGRHVHGTKRDELGTITDVGHMDHESFTQAGERAGRNLYRDFGKNLMRGLQTGAAGAIVAGPFGGLGGFAAGFLSSSIKDVVGGAFGDIKYETMHHVTSTEKHDHVHYHDTYKGPSSDFFGFLKGLGGSGGHGGGGHGDHGHGGGHDDHGGGHH